MYNKFCPGQINWPLFHPAWNTCFSQYCKSIIFVDQTYTVTCAYGIFATLTPIAVLPNPSHIGPYSWKRNNYGPGISLTTQDLIFLSFVLWVNFTSWKWRTKLREVLKALVTSISPCFHLLFHFENNRKIKSCPFSQTYSWNKGGLKLFLFQEYRPLGLYNTLTLDKETWDQSSKNLLTLTASLSNYRYIQVIIIDNSKMLSFRFYWNASE